MEVDMCDDGGCDALEVVAGGDSVLLVSVEVMGFGGRVSAELVIIHRDL